MPIFASTSITRVTWHVAGVICLLLAGLVAPANAASTSTGFQLRVFKDDAGTAHKYYVFVPANYVPTKKWPVILFLHGAGERGTDGVLPTTYGIGPTVNARRATFPFFVVFPQCEDVKGRILTGWNATSPDGLRAMQILEEVEHDYSIDRKREILTGWSMGGFGAFSLAAAHPDRWLSVMPLSGGGDPETASALKDVPLWAMHGAHDRVVPVDRTRKMIDAIKAAGGTPRYTEFPDGDHNICGAAYDDDAVYQWMLAPHQDPKAVPQQHTALRPIHQPDPPFVPALEMPRAVYVRLGNDLLQTIADSIPFVIPRDLLSGRLPDVSDSTESSGHSFTVYFSGISYRGQLARAAVKAYAKDRVNIQLGLSNVQITIGATQVQGSGRKGATAGPMGIMIAHARPAWLSFDVMPVVEHRKLRLKLLETRFHIDADNFQVSGPGGVSTSGFGVTSQKVTDGLVSGLYSSRSRIEQQVKSIVPGLLGQIESRLDLSEADRVVSGIWPLPVYQPRLRVWPAEVSTDTSGISVLLGVTAANFNPQTPPGKVQIVDSVGTQLAALPHTAHFQFGVAPDILNPLTQLLIRQGMAHIHVLDTPAKTLGKFVDPKFMAEAIPDLKRYGNDVQLWSELVLASPITVVDGPAAAGDQAAASVTDTENSGPAKTQLAAFEPNVKSLAFDVPKLKIAVSIKTDPDSLEWKPYAELDVDIRQLAQPQIVKRGHDRRVLELSWAKSADIQIEGRFVPGYEPQDSELKLDALKEAIVVGWREFTEEGSATDAELPDIDLGYTKLRAADVLWSNPYLSATFGPPGVKLSNASQQPFVYETKGPYSGWGGPYTLKPGESVQFNIAYPLLLRRNTQGGVKTYTLPAGSANEFFVPAGKQSPELYKAPEKDAG